MVLPPELNAQVRGASSLSCLPTRPSCRDHHSLGCRSEAAARGDMSRPLPTLERCDQTMLRRMSIQLRSAGVTDRRLRDWAPVVIGAPASR
jgi:hypothetical protein